MSFLLFGRLKSSLLARFKFGIGVCVSPKRVDKEEGREAQVRGRKRTKSIL